MCIERRLLSRNVLVIYIILFFENTVKTFQMLCEWKEYRSVCDSDTLILLIEGMCMYVIEFGADPNGRIV